MGSQRVGPGHDLATEQKQQQGICFSTTQVIPTSPSPILNKSLFFMSASPLCAKSLQSCPTLCSPMDHSPQGTSVHGILQAGTLEWLPFPTPGDLHQPRSNLPHISCIGRWVLYQQHHLGSCPANRIISSTFLDSMYICWYMMLLSFWLTHSV